MITSAKRLPAENDISGWEAISQRSFAVRSLEGNVTADWLISGAGFAGLSAARRLLQLRPNDKIVILDASEIGKGTSGRNSGYMIDVPHNLSSSEYSSGSADATRSCPGGGVATAIAMLSGRSREWVSLPQRAGPWIAAFNVD